MQASVPDLLLEGGRKLVYERNFGWERDVKPKKGFWARVVDVVAGPPEYHTHGEALQCGDRFARADYRDGPGCVWESTFLILRSRSTSLFRATIKGKNSLFAPQCVAVDAKDNIYVTDSESGKIFVFDANGKYDRMIGALKYGEGIFKRPTGIAIDSAAGRIYVSDTLRNKIYVMDMQGSVVQTIGKPGGGEGEFNFPTELRLDGNNLIVVDAMNFRVQVLDKSGTFQYAIGRIGDTSGAMFRPKGIAVDSEGDLYVVDGLWGAIQVFNRQGELLYYFGRRGTAAGTISIADRTFY